MTELHFPAAHLGRRVLVHEILASTNDVAAGLGLDPANEGLAVVARHQSAGRGQYGRVWQSRPGASLLLSLIVQPPPALRRPVILTAWAAVAVGDAVAEFTGVVPVVKWPNDLLAGGKKVCGILIEQSAAVVLGLGLNVNQTADEFAAAGLPDATSLTLLTPGCEPPAWDAVLESVLRCLDRRYAEMLDSPDGIEGQWRARARLVGRAATVELADGTAVPGVVRSLGFDAVELDCGEVVPRVWPPERVRGVRPAADAW